MAVHGTMYKILTIIKQGGNKNKIVTFYCPQSQSITITSKTSDFFVMLQKNDIDICMIEAALSC